MRMGIGLVAILVFVGIYVVWFSETQVPIAKQGNAVRQSAEKIAGYGQDGRPATESAKMEPREKNGRTASLTVTEVVPGGALGQHFGLMKGDEIVRVGDLDVRNIDGGEMAIAMVYEAIQRQYSLVVLRGEQRITLPAARTAPAGPASSASQDAADPVRRAVKIPMH